MIPSARIQAAIELLDQIIEAARTNGAPADRIIAEWFRSRRYAGSGDRRAVRELVYGAIRACGPIPETGRAAMLRLAQSDDQILGLFDGSQYGPELVGENEIPAKGGLAPEWLVSALGESGIHGEEAAGLLARAPLDLRINTLRGSAPDLPMPGEPTLAENGLRFPTGTMVQQWPAWRDGLIEVQDSASQLACAVVAAAPGETVIDLCAGAGGKTLALAASMENSGTLLACDIDRSRLSQLGPRAERAGVANVETLLLNPKRELEKLADWQGRANAVLVDAPCSGTGTWRRNPEARWRLGEDALARYAQAQADLLKLAATLLRPGGRLVYAVCSLLDREGPAQIDKFLQAHPEWSADMVEMDAGRVCGKGIRLTPFHDGTDGFFVARLVPAC